VKPNHSEHEINNGRGNPNNKRPWCWQEKATLKTIRDVFGSTAASALAVYVTLTEIASDAQSDTFTRSIGEIAARARVSYRTASAILNGFQALKLLDVKRNTIEGTKLQAPNTYTLGNYRLAVGNGRQRASLPRKKESPEKSQKKSDSLSAGDKGHSEFVRLWCERFQAVTGERYAFQGGKDGKAVKLLLTTTGLRPSQLVAIAEKAWKRPTGFWSKFATSIAGYNSRFNQIRKETTDAMAITTSGRDAGRLARARRSQYAGVGKLR
jgi:hypothetical protein